MVCATFQVTKRPIVGGYALLIAACLASCSTPPVIEPAPVTLPPALAASVVTEHARYSPLPVSALPGWQKDELRGVWQAWQANCASPRVRALARMAALCEAARALAVDKAVPPSGPSLDALRGFIEQHFQAWAVQSLDGKAEGLLTGYYEPVLKGARSRSARFDTPLLARPDDMLAVVSSSPSGDIARSRRTASGNVPYYSRATLPRNAARALVWVENPVEALFLQIQGSGRIELPDGSQIRMAYADNNGHPYKSVGKWLIEQGELRAEQASMQGIKAWAARNPARLEELLNANPRVVFFKEEPIADEAGAVTQTIGPKGALGVPLVAQRSAAVDVRSVPLGSLLWLDSTEPLSDKPLQQLVFAQDVGSAILGAVRADFYWGTGVAAGESAGRTKQVLKTFLLLPQGVKP